MGDHSTSRTAFFYRGVTLNTLKDELYALNTQMLLAMENHDEAARITIAQQAAEVQGRIDRMKLGR